MILDKLTNSERYTCMHPLFTEAFRYLQQTDLSKAPAGVHDIKGKELFAIVSEASGIAKQEAKLEVHRKYIDIQYIITGTDHMGWKDLEQCGPPNDPYQAERDAAFFADITDNWFNVPAGSFAIFYPDDAHAAMVTDKVVRKVVLKIAV